MKRALTSAIAAALAGLCLAQPATAAEGGEPSVERGRYLVKISGCNDCHTRDYATKGGQVPEQDWLTGNPLGWRGPWGTTYATNLRLYFAALSEDDWVRTGKTLTARPPMPWFNVREMTEADLRSLYRYVRALEPAGAPAPAYLPPQQEPRGPVVAFPAAQKP